MNSKKLKIAMVTTTFFPQVGGAEYQVKWLAEGLAKKEHEVYLFTPYDAEEFIDSDERGFPKNIALRTNNTFFLFDGIRMLYSFIKWIYKIKPDIIHSHFAFSSGFLAVITKPIHNVPVVITSHGEDIQVMEDIKYGMRRNAIKNILIKYTLKKCDKHVLVSNSMRFDAINAGSDNQKIQVIYNMFVSPQIQITEMDIQNVKLKYDINPRKKIILSVSRLHSQKGLKYLIESMEGVSKRCSNALLVIAGDGDEKQKLERLVNEKNLDDYVKFIGFIEEHDKFALIKGCNIFSLPAIEEAFGIALFDPMYYSKPIVASNVGGIPELLGDCGTLVPKRDSKALSESIIKLLQNNTFQDTNVFNQLKHFYLDVILKEYEYLYLNLMLKRV